jgi:hypothetical protein
MASKQPSHPVGGERRDQHLPHPGVLGVLGVVVTLRPAENRRVRQ